MRNFRKILKQDCCIECRNLNLDFVNNMRFASCKLDARDDIKEAKLTPDNCKFCICDSFDSISKEK